MENEKKIIEPKESIWKEEDTTKDTLANTLVFDKEERLLTREEIKKLIWAKLWVRYQPLISRHSRHIEYQEPIYCTIDKIYSAWELWRSDLEPQRPSIAADKDELAEILRAWWYMLEHSWRSGFESRNSYTISKNNPKKQKITAPLVTEWWLEIADKVKFWLDWNLISTDKFVVRTGKPHEWEIILESEIKETQEAIKRAYEEIKKRRTEKIKEYIHQNKQWDISVISVWWWPESYSEGEIPDNYEIISGRRIACTADHRRNMTHMYEMVIIDKKIFEKKSFVKIKVPDAYKGMVIGKWWEKIKSLSEKFRCKIKIE